MNKFIQSYIEIINEEKLEGKPSSSDIKKLIKEILKENFVDVKLSGSSEFTFSRILIKNGNKKYIKDFNLNFNYTPSESDMINILVKSSEDDKEYSFDIKITNDIEKDISSKLSKIK